jgi:SPP1 family predicted phage head-tail adaptor
MNIGELRLRVDIYQIVQGTDDFGGVDTIENLNPLGSFWAKIEDRSSASNYARNQQLTVSEYKITIRDAKLPITTSCFVKWEQKQLKIEGIEKQAEGKHHWLILRCSNVG